MPYVVTRLKPKNRNDIDSTEFLLDFLADAIPLDSMFPHSKLQLTGTRTYYYDRITPEKRAELNISKQIEILEKFYDQFKELDINNNTTEYNYDLQVSLISQYKREGMGIEAAELAAKEELTRLGYKYNNNYNTFFRLKASSTPGHTKWRRIDAPNRRLKLCLSNLKSIFEILMNGCYYHTAAFAYIHNRCTKDVAEKHARARSNWFLKLDFSDFFGSTNIEFVLKMFSEIFPFSEIIREERGKNALKNCLSLCFLNGGLPQGTPMSPIITNIMMIPIDHKLYNGFRKKKAVSSNGNKQSFTYTRYADDIYISNKFKFDHNEIVANVKAVLAQYDAPFKLNEEKTRFNSNAGQNWMLGLMVNQNHEVTVGYRRKKSLKAAINNFMIDRSHDIKWCLDDLYHLQGEISYCKSIEPESINRIITDYSKKYGDVIAAIKADIKAALKVAA